MGVSIGYIGIDHHHRDPYFAIASNLDATIDAVCEPGRDVDPTALAAMDDRPDEITTEDEAVADLVAGAEVYSDPYRLVETAAVDLVWITYRNDHTPGIVQAAVDEGIHVISEKPIGRTAGDLEAIKASANEAGVTVAPSTFYRNNPILRELRDRVSAGFFGEVWTVEGRFHASQLGYRDTSHYLYDAAVSRGGALQWIGPHWVDFMPWVLGDPIVRVNARLHPAAECDVEAGAVLQFETAGGTLGTYHTGYYLDERGKDTHFAIYGTDAQARTPVHHDALQTNPEVGIELTSGRQEWAATDRRRLTYEFSYERFPAWGDYVQDYFARIIDGLGTTDVPASVDDAVQLLRVLDAAYASAETGEWVAVEGGEGAGDST